APSAAYQVQRSAGAFPQQRGGRDDPLDLLDDRLAVVAEFGQAQRPERQADAGADPGFLLCIDPHQLDAAAAEIPDDTIGVGDAGQDPGRRQPSLLAAVDDPY